MDKIEMLEFLSVASGGAVIGFLVLKYGKILTPKTVSDILNLAKDAISALATRSYALFAPKIVEDVEVVTKDIESDEVAVKKIQLEPNGTSQKGATRQ